MSTYTVRDLTILMNNISQSTSVDQFVTGSRIDETKFLSLLSDLLHDRINYELKARKKRVVKLINVYKENNADNYTISAIDDYLSGDVTETIKNIFSSKSNAITDDEANFYIRDFREFFGMFSDSTNLNEVLNTCK